MKIRFASGAGATGTILWFLLLSNIAVAQGGRASAPIEEPALTEESAPIEEIIVTTRKRAENLQDIPLSMSVLPADFIREAGVRGLQDVVKFSPSLQFDQSFSQNSIRVTVRGLSNTRGRANVAFLVDGIDVTSETTGTNAGSPLLVNQRLLNDVERIEVVQGPQSALFGRAAFAGAINYVTAEPSEKPEARVDLDMAEDGRTEAAGMFSLPLSNKLGFRVNGVYWDADGHHENVVSGAGFGGGDGRALSTNVVWNPRDTLKFKGRLSWSDDDYDPGAVASLRSREVTLPIPADAAPVTQEQSVDVVNHVGNASSLIVRSSEDPQTGGEYPGNEMEVKRASLIASWDIGDYTLGSWTGYTDADFSQRYDLDRQASGRPDTILGHAEVDTKGSTEQFSQELRLATNWANSPIQFTFGGLYWTEDRDDFSRNISAACLSSATCIADGINSWQEIYARVIANAADFRDPKEAETDHWSAYGMVEWSIGRGWTLTVEDRYVDEEFDATLYTGSSCSVTYPTNRFDCLRGVQQKGNTQSDYHTPKVTLEWSVNDQVMTFLSAGKGVKPSGISLLTLPVPFPLPLEPYFFDEEEMWAYELGFKTNWAGNFGALTFNGAVFYQDYSDKQTNTQQEIFPGFIIGVVTNASSAEAGGVELQLAWDTPIEGLELGLAYTYLDTEYDDFKDATRSATRIAIAGTCGEVVDVSGTPHCELDLGGNELEFAPENSLLVTGRYVIPIKTTDLDAFLSWNFNYQDERFTSADNFTKLNDYWLMDLRAGLEGDRWNFIGYVENVFDEDTIRSSGGNIDFAEGFVDGGSIAPPGIPTAFLPDPRTFGIRMSYSF